MPICPECGYEYKTGIVECPDCSVALVDQLYDESYHERKIIWKRLPSQPGRIYTEMLMEMLENEDIPCIFDPGNTSYLTIKGSSDVGSKTSLLVPEEDYDRALQLIDNLMNSI